MLLAFLQLGCSTGNSYRYKIGVSQCVGGPWRDKVNNEMLSAQHLYDTDVEVTIVDANNNNARQCEQIDSMVNSGVDLLIVSPNDYYALDKSLQRAKEKQIPIVFFDRKTSFNDYTAYIGGDNVDAGRQMGRYAAKLCRDSMVAVKTRRPVVLEIKGPEEISPSAERHKGFAEEMRQHADINYQCVPSSWSYEDSKAIMEKWLSDGKPVDVVFCHSDNATMGAYDAAKKVGRERDIKFLGIDGLPGEGIDAVQRGQLEASYIYPTHGEEVIALALNILEHKAYKRDNILKSFVVTPANVADIAISSNALINQNKYLTTIQGKLETYLGFYHIQRTLLLVLLLVVVLLVTAVGMTLRAVTVTRRANRRMREMNDEQTRFFTNASHQLRTPLTLIAGPLQQLLKGHLMNGTDKAEQSAGDKATNADTLRLLNIMKRNVEQLQQLVNDVLLFRKETNATVDDTTAVTDELKAESLKAVQENRHKIAVNDSADELATVLVVDDNADMRAYLRTLLLDHYYVIEASDGQSGLHLAVESVPDIVVSDVMMPIMDGLTFCSRLKQHAATSHIPVILLTARSSEQQHIEGLHTGADVYMTKPFSADLLLANIASLLENRQRLRRLFANNHEAETSEEPEAENTIGKAATPERRFLDQFVSAMNKHLADTQLKVDDLGAEMGLSRVQLYRKVKALTGLSPVEILRETRLKKAHHLLLTTDNTISEVAYSVGFATPAYFSSCFKKQYGKYPTELRDEHNKL